MGDLQNLAYLVPKSKLGHYRSPGELDIGGRRIEVKTGVLHTGQNNGDVITAANHVG
jgi:hypothetical protein